MASNPTIEAVPLALRQTDTPAHIQKFLTKQSPFVPLFADQGQQYLARCLERDAEKEKERAKREKEREGEEKMSSEVGSGWSGWSGSGNVRERGVVARMRGKIPSQESAVILTRKEIKLNTTTAAPPPRPTPSGSKLPTKLTQQPLASTSKTNAQPSTQTPPPKRKAEKLEQNEPVKKKAKSEVKLNPVQEEKEVVSETESVARLAARKLRRRRKAAIIKPPPPPPPAASSSASSSEIAKPSKPQPLTARVRAPHALSEDENEESVVVVRVNREEKMEDVGKGREKAKEKATKAKSKNEKGKGKKLKSKEVKGKSGKGVDWLNAFGAEHMGTGGRLTIKPPMRGLFKKGMASTKVVVANREKGKGKSKITAPPDLVFCESTFLNRKPAAVPNESPPSESSLSSLSSISERPPAKLKSAVVEKKKSKGKEKAEQPKVEQREKSRKGVKERRRGESDPSSAASEMGGAGDDAVVVGKGKERPYSPDWPASEGEQKKQNREETAEVESAGTGERGSVPPTDAAESNHPAPIPETERLPASHGTIHQQRDSPGPTSASARAARLQARNDRPARFSLQASQPRSHTRQTATPAAPVAKGHGRGAMEAVRMAMAIDEDVHILGDGWGQAAEGEMDAWEMEMGVMAALVEPQGLEEIEYYAAEERMADVGDADAGYMDLDGQLYPLAQAPLQPLGYVDYNVYLRPEHHAHMDEDNLELDVEMEQSAYGMGMIPDLSYPENEYARDGHQDRSEMQTDPQHRHLQGQELPVQSFEETFDITYSMDGEDLGVGPTMMEDMDMPPSDVLGEGQAQEDDEDVIDMFGTRAEEATRRVWGNGPRGRR